MSFAYLICLLLSIVGVYFFYKNKNQIYNTYDTYIQTPMDNIMSIQPQQSPVRSFYWFVRDFINPS